MQFVNLVLWVANLQYGFVSSLNIVFFWCMWIGVHSGTAYTNFIFLASSKTNLENDMHLKYNERELVVNFLLLANMTGQLIGEVFSFNILINYYPNLINNPPG